MCGGFVAVASQSSRPVLGQSLYHLGRLMTYLLLGALAGAAGSMFNLAGENIGIQRTASIVAGAILVLWGVTMLRGHSLHVAFFDSLVHRLRSRVHLGTRSELLLPFSLGLTSTLLPCGWLYSYITVAAGTGDPLAASAVMLLFWLGTLPVLLTIGSLSRFISTPLKRHLPMVTALLIIASGFFSMFGHFGHASGHHSASESACGHSMH